MKIGSLRGRLVQTVLAVVVAIRTVATASPAFATTVTTYTITALWGASRTTGSVPPDSGTYAA